MKTLHAFHVGWRWSALLLLPLLMVALLCTPARALASDNSGDDMVVFGGHQTVQEGQDVDGDLVVLGGSADVYGHVHGDAVAIGGKIYIAPQGEVDGSFVSLGGSIDNQSSVTPHTRTVKPRHTFGPIPPIPPVATQTPEEPASLVNGWTTFVLIDALLVLVAFLLFPVKTREAMEYLLENPLVAGIAGFFSPIILALVLVALAITVIGIPLIPLVLVMTALGYLVGKAALAAFVGNRLFEVAHVQSPKPIASMLIGLLILTVISMFSWEGFVIYFLIGAISLGAALYGLVRVLNSRRRLTSYIPPVPPPQPPPAHEFAPPAGPAPTGPPAVP